MVQTEAQYALFLFIIYGHVYTSLEENGLNMRRRANCYVLVSG